MTNLRTIKTGKIYKPKFHTVLQCANNKIEKSFLSFTSTNSSSSMTVIVVPKPNLEYQVEEHIDKIITNNHVLIDTMDPRLYKLIQRQQSLVETKQFIDQPLNLSFAKEFLRKGCYSESFVQQCKVCLNKSKRGSIIKNLLLKNQNSCRKSKTKNGNYYFVPHSNTNILNIHRRYYWNGSSRRKYQLEIEKRESNLNSKSSDYYSNLMSFPSCDSLLGNTRLIDTYISPMKKHRLEFVQTALQSLEELDKCPRINSLQMFGGENRILNNTGESKMITFESQSINSRKNEEIVSNKCITSETSSVVIRSDLHSGGTMVYKPLVSTSSSFISLPNVTKILSPIIPNISTPSILSTTSVNLTKTEKSETKLIENSDVSSKEKIKPNKFLRHISLSLKPGTFTTKKYHEITPTGNMLPLISPETPRSKKSYRQLYLNRHAYTYFGLKCSTRVFYCTLNKPQPMYVTQQHYGLSMYSNWKICKEAPSDIDMAHYDSKHRPVNYTIAWKKQEDILTHSSHRFTTPFNSDSDLDSDMQKKARRIKMLDEDLESNKNNMYGKEKGKEILSFLSIMLF